MSVPAASAGTVGRRWIYSSRPTDSVSSANYTIETEQVDASALESEEVMLQGRHYSVDPYMRIQQSASDSWEAPHPLGAVQGGGVVGVLLAVGKSVTHLKAGDWVYAYAGWREYARLPASSVTLLAPPTASVPASSALGVLGMPARTAFFGLTEIGRPRVGDVLVVSGAAGAVGLIVAQLAKLSGCTVIGVAGSDEKCNMLTQPPYNLDHALNYKDLHTKDLMKRALARVSPGGVDIYWDNTGGPTSDAVFESLAVRARVIVCGSISQYGHLDDTQQAQGPRFLHHFLYKRATMQGVLARDYAHRNEEMIAHLRPLVESRKLVLPETFMHGFEQLPNALAALFTGKNTGKMIVSVE